MKAFSKSRKLLSLLLALIMVASMTGMSAFAVENGYSLAPYDSNVTTLTLSGVSVNGYTVTSNTLGTNVVQTYNIVLASTTSSTASVTINFTTPEDNAVSPVGVGGNPAQMIPMVGSSATDTYTVTLTSGVGTKTVYVHENFPDSFGNCDTYIFNFSIAENDDSTDYSGMVDVGNGVMVRFGDPDYPNTAPECYMDLNYVNSKWLVSYTGPTTNYYPDVLSVMVVGRGGEITKLVGDGVQFVTYTSTGTKVPHTEIEPSENVNDDEQSDLYTVEIGAQGGSITVYKGALTATIYFYAPQQTGSSGEAVDDFINGYLPIGQFATGSGWGSATGKFQNGIESTGVSLGMLGGYIQFDMSDDPIENAANNKYGIDFVIYGNPFDGNPEAGSVKVYGRNTATNQYGWYNLAGSRHYMSDTNWDVDISYIKISAANTTVGTKTFAAAGIYTSRNYPFGDVESGSKSVAEAVSAATWDTTPFTTSTGWWPSADKYNVGDDSVDGVYWHNTSNASVITYEGVTEVIDSDVNNDYLFGYVDVRAAGSYGSVTNPYASAPSEKSGGDGFDLSWAVDESGNPVSVTDVEYVRVYSAVLYDAGIFGETSTEVCGIYVMNGGGSTQTTATPQITVSGTSQTTSNGGTTTIRGLGITACTVNVSGSGYIFINGEAVTSASITPSATGTKVQIIVQNGNAAPYITLLVLKSGRSID